MKPAIYERTSNFDSDSSKNLPEKPKKEKILDLDYLGVFEP